MIIVIDNIKYATKKTNSCYGCVFNEEYTGPFCENAQKIINKYGYSCSEYKVIFIISLKEILKDLWVKLHTKEEYIIQFQK